MNDFVRRIRDIGISKLTDKTEMKRIRLFNVFCMCWIAFSLLFSLTDFLFMESPMYNIITHTVSLFFMILLLYFQKKQWYLSAKVFYIVYSLINFVAFANVLEPNSMMEFFLLLVPMIAVIFIDEKWINWLVLVLTYILFYVPILLFDHYSTLDVNPVTNMILFFATFVIVNYFKQLNSKNESLLKEQRNEVIETKNQLEKQHKELEELYAFQSHFMVNLSHEIRTPLTLIKGGSSELRSEKETSKVLAINDRIDNNADKIKHLVDNIIDIAKMNANKLELNKKLFHIIPFILKTTSSFDSLFTQKNIKFSIEKYFKNQDILINGDKIYLERALSNLIMNAHKYCSDGDSVTIKIMAKDNIFKVEILDTGCGIPKNDIEKIFESFYRAKNSVNQAGGSGVGLSFAKEVITLHSGELTVESELNKGARFIVSLPYLVSEKPLMDKGRNILPELQKYKGLNVLLVEDNIEMQHYLKGVLSVFDVCVASNGLDALRSVEKNTPDLIITDYMMPEMDGYEFVQKIKKQGINCPVIVLTARMDETAKLDFLRLGIDDYLTKPFNEEELLIRIEHSLTNNLEKDKVIDNEENPVVDKLLGQAKKIVLDNLESYDFGVSNLADKLALTERTLYRKLKTMTGLSTNQFIREVKLLEAKKMLESNSDITIKEIRLKVGFKNSSHFAKIYEERFGIKPSS